MKKSKFDQLLKYCLIDISKTSHIIGVIRIGWIKRVKRIGHIFYFSLGISASMRSFKAFMSALVAYSTFGCAGVVKSASLTSTNLKHLSDV